MLFITKEFDFLYWRGVLLDPSGHRLSLELLEGSGEGAVTAEAAPMGQLFGGKGAVGG